MSERSSRLDAVGCDVGASSSWERRAGPNMSRGGTQARFFGAPPRFFAQEQRNGVESAVGGDRLLPKETAHTQPRANEVLPCLCFVRVRRYVGRWFLACPAFRPHFFGACPKKRCRAAKEKRFYYLGGSTIRVSATASVVFTHLRPTWGGLGGCRGWVGAKKPAVRTAGFPAAAVGTQL